MPNSNKIFVIDFDSTFIKSETLDLMALFSLQHSPESEKIINRIRDITNAGMEGKIKLSESLQKRIELLRANRVHIEPLIEKIREDVSLSFRRNKKFFRDFADQIFIVSNGFKEIIAPIVSEYSIKLENVYANTFTYNAEGDITGFDEENILSRDNGKVELLKTLNLQGDIYVIGDGYSDYQVKEAGLANKFYAFTENIERDPVIEKADHVAPNLDEILFHNKIEASISYPKNRISVLLLENIHPKARDLLRQEGYSVEVLSSALDEDGLAEKIRNVSILGIRSKTQVTRKVLQNANRLMAIGAFCIGTNQIDLDACLEKGIAVFNAPFSNTRSVVELAIGEIIMLIRNLPDKSRNMHDGIWDKSARGSFEIRGKNLGIIGYGNIGSQLSILAESLGMNVYYFDVIEKLALGNARKCISLEELLIKSDIISLHVDGRPENGDLIGAGEFMKMRNGVIFLNLSRGHVVDIEALRKAIFDGKVAGAAIDVFPSEPRNNEEGFTSELRNLPNTILTPHIGGSTLEAQENIAQFVPMKIIDYINSGSTTNSINFPEIQLPAFKDAHRLIHIHHNVPGILAKINQVLASHNINVVGQYLKTNEKIGYMILAVNREYDREVITEFRSIENTIRFRILY
ncbi:MAG: phosphoglycerate dehydrogenase [Cyclobacteriaceae bacterium]|nr:phosphoglycerate dehydrogenase [Cyclobacteriaceae bacterium]